MNRSDSIIDALGELKGLHAGNELPAPQRLDSIRTVITGSLKPVRPLPSNGSLIVLAVALFVAFSILAAVPVGFLGFHRLSSGQRWAYYTVILFSAAWLCSALVKEIIPGSRRRWSSTLVMITPVAFVALVAFALFPKPDFTHFSKVGLPCLELGTLCAAASGFIAWLFLRRGFSASRVQTAATAGLFAGLAGVAVLALKCPVQNIAHILVWHLGSMLVGVAVGALIGLLQLGAAPPAREAAKPRASA